MSKKDGDVVEKEMDEVRRKLMEVKLPGDTTITLSLRAAEAEALTRLCERLAPAQLMDIAGGREEAMQMLGALGKLALALSDAR